MSLYLDDGDVRLYQGDVRKTLQELPAESVHCVVTSPPYWGLRDYGTGSWTGGDPGCDHVARRQGGQEQEAEQRERGESRGYAPGSNFTNYGQGWTAEVYRDVCGKCGATRQDNQLGLEPTPDAYLDSMVDVFREVRRVLRADGTCWVNMGDSYNAGTSAKRKASPDVQHGYWEQGGEMGDERVNVPGLKVKDLCMIPARLALALQQPYYTGRIKDERDRIWLAAMVDAEGCIHIHRRKAGTDSGAKFTKKDGTTVSYARKQDTYGVMVSIDNTSRAIVDRCEQIVGQGSRYVHEAGTGKQKRKQTLYRLTLTGQQSRDLLRELYPHLTAKQHEARIAIACPSSGNDGAAAQEAIKALHNGRDTTVDYPAPPSLHEPGWYLRSVICWAKSNPMPESVTDRPTTSHEYVYLLAKSKSYYFDQEAVREPHKPESIDRQRTGLNAASAHDGFVASHRLNRNGAYEPASGRNLRSVWEIPTQPYPEAHFATYPEELVRRCILAGTSERGCCRECGAPWVREVERTPMVVRPSAGREAAHAAGSGAGRRDTRGTMTRAPSAETVGWKPNDACHCYVEGHNLYHAPPSIPCTVLDPFSGSGTTALVARKHGRHAVGVELNPAYNELAARRLSQLSLLSEASA